MLKGIIFDFDGVIAELVQIQIDAFADLYKPYGPDIVMKVVETMKPTVAYNVLKK